MQVVQFTEIAFLSTQPLTMDMLKALFTNPNITGDILYSGIINAYAYKASLL